jgi:hypothetical protein
VGFFLLGAQGRPSDSVKKVQKFWEKQILIIILNVGQHLK